MTSTAESSSPIPVLFIGAGISSLYSAYQWCKRFPERANVVIVEQSGRIGGRIQTIHKKTGTFEAGAGRISSSHVILLNLIRELRLDHRLIPLSANTQYIIDGDALNTDDDVSRHYRLGDGNNKTVSDIWKHIFLSYTMNRANRTRASRMTLSEYIQTIGLRENEIRAVTETFGYIAEFQLWNASHAIETMTDDHGIDPLSPRRPHAFYILQGGLDQLVDALVERLRGFGVKFLLNTECVRVESYKTHCRVHLHQYNANARDPNPTDATTEFYFIADQCVLGCPSTAFQAIKYFSNAGTPRSRVRINITKRYLPEGYPLFRIYARYPIDKKTGKVWFHGQPKTITNSPVGMIIPIDPTNGVIMISYTDGRNTAHWNQFGSQEELYGELRAQLRTLFPDKRIPSPTWLSLHYWNEGCHVWTKRNHGRHQWMKLLETFERQMHHNVFWVNEACSFHQAWIEGGLQMSRRWFEKRCMRDSRIANAESNTIGGGGEPRYTKQEVARHNSINDAWTIIDGVVYDITKWIPNHPGGTLAIMQIAGKDGTALFRGNPIHAQKGAMNILKKYRIGQL